MSPKKARYIIGTILALALGALAQLLTPGWSPYRSVSRQEAEHALPGPSSTPSGWAAGSRQAESGYARLHDSSRKSAGVAEEDALSEAEAPPFSEHWFIETEIGADLRLTAPLPVATVIRWDSGCTGHPLRRHGELVELSRETFGVDPSLILQGNLLPSSHTVFWREDAMFRQIAVNWELDDPATYRVDAYESAEPTLTRGVIRLPEPQPARRNLVVHAETLQDLYGQRGAIREYGARLVTYLVKTSDEASPGLDYEISLLNQQVTAVHGPDLSCASSRDFQTAVCSCSLEGSGWGSPSGGRRP